MIILFLVACGNSATQQSIATVPPTQPPIATVPPTQPPIATVPPTQQPIATVPPAKLTEQKFVSMTGKALADSLKLMNADGYAVTSFRWAGTGFEAIFSRGSGLNGQVFSSWPLSQVPAALKEASAKGYAVTSFIRLIEGTFGEEATYFFVLSQGSGLQNQFIIEDISKVPLTVLTETDIKIERFWNFSDVLKEANAQGYAVTAFDGYRAIFSKGSALNEQLFINRAEPEQFAVLTNNTKLDGHAITGFTYIDGFGGARYNIILSKGSSITKQVTTTINDGSDMQTDFNTLLADAKDKKQAVTGFNYIPGFKYLVMLSTY